MSLSLAKTKKRMKNALYDMKQVKKHRPLLIPFPQMCRYSNNVKEIQVLCDQGLKITGKT